MAVTPQLMQLVGRWRGRNRLWLSPDAPVRESPATAMVATVAQGRFLSVQYTWVDEGQPQEGLILLGHAADGTAQAAWVDSWHMGDVMMHCRGALRHDGSALFAGHYAAPTGPDWGWEILLAPKTGGGWRLAMFNVPPDCSSELAVEILFARAD